VRGLAQPGGSPLMGVVAEDSSNLQEQLHDLLNRAGEFALDSKQLLSTRVAAVKLLSQADYQHAGRLLEALIEPQQPLEVQAAAIRTLTTMASAQSTSALLRRERWNAYSQAVRDVALSVLAANTNSLASLLTAVESGDVPAWTIPAERRTQLMNHRNEAIRSRAQKLFKDLIPGDRMKAFLDAKSVLSLKGDGGNGHLVFQKNCISCHTFAGEGKRVGPDLTGVRNQPPDVLLSHIIVPEQEIVPVYTSYHVETKSGELFTGLLAAEMPSSITLRMAHGIEQEIPRKDIAMMTTSRLSLMPQELEKTMTKQELADLLAFLKGQ